MTSSLRVSAKAVLLDIEGTIAPTSFVHEVLFAYSKARLADFVDRHHHDPVVAAILAEAKALAGGDDPVTALTTWQNNDVKAPPLKKLQGMIWESGFRSGAFKSALFYDALRALRRWHAKGLHLHIYSSGSVHAQHLLFEFNVAGDLRPLLSGYLDTDMGPKVDSQSYLRIAEKIGLACPEIVFFSDNPAELAAAHSVHMQVVQVIKESTAADKRFPGISDFDEIAVTVD